MKNGDWHLTVATPGRYAFELRRWPAESKLALSEEAPLAQLFDGQLPPGVGLPIAQAEIEIGGHRHQMELPTGVAYARFEVALEAGPTILRTRFLRADDTEICGAYYVQVERLPAPDESK